MKWLFLILPLLPVGGSAAVDVSKEQAEFFETKVRPVLSENCYRCHSAEGGKNKGGFTLDSRDGMLKGGESGPAVVPGDPAKSVLIRAIGYLDPDLQMPPKGEKLTAAQIADLAAWVKMGAPVPAGGEAIVSKLTGLTDKARQHWSYLPVRKPAVPVNKNQRWCRTPLDCFILQKIEAAGMLPSPDAPGETLLRRAYFDIIGLPPSPQEVEAFLLDKSPQAWMKVVDRLLASPHYGERWGRHWMDTARYSDTAGTNVNGMDYRYPHAWTYRDWVVNALNADMPYDRFITCQLAADLLPKEEQGRNGEHLAALGFITVGERFGNPNDLINERIDTVTKGTLAMTVACARCHDHMFDPISQKDYYALHGVFASITEPRVKPMIGLPPPADAFADFSKREGELQKEIRDSYFRVLGRINEGFRLKSPLYLEAFTLSRTVSGEGEKISPYQAFVRANKLDDDTVRSLERRIRRKDDPVFGPLALFGALKSGEFAAAAPAVVAQIRTGLLPGKGGRRINSLVVAAFKDAKPESIKDVWKLYDNVFAMAAPKSAAWLDEMATGSTGVAAGVDQAMADILQVPLEVKPGGSLAIADFPQLIERLPNRGRGEVQGALAKHNELLLTHPGAPAHAMIVADKPQPQDSPVLIRGQADNRGPTVQRRFLDVLSAGGKGTPFTQGSGRLELARCIANKDNPRTARVMVNRVWMHHFGEGLVATPDDLGVMSEKPSHPEMLDYLANYFVENGWSLKKLHRLILNSRVYMESSHVIGEYQDKDPYNRFFWRANVRRLDFEAMRDSLLVFSGRLERSIGGKPVNVTDEPYSFRRSVYGYVDRGNLPELMAHFDFAKPDMANSKRTSTVVPQQALFLMNSPMTVDVVRRIVSRPEVAAAKGDLGRISAIYRIIFQRSPTQAEYQMALGFIQVEARDTVTSSFASKPVKNQDRNRNDGRAPIKNEGFRVARQPLSPWEAYTQALLCSNEAAYVN